MEIRLSPRYGVNPAIPRCFFCLEDKPEVILAGRMKEDREAPRGAVWDMTPCPACAEWMRQGVILISVQDESPREDPWRTGGWCVVKEEAIRRMALPRSVEEDLCRSRVGFLEDRVWRQLGLSREREGQDGV